MRAMKILDPVGYEIRKLQREKEELHDDLNRITMYALGEIKEEMYRIKDDVRDVKDDVRYLRENS